MGRYFDGQQAYISKLQLELDKSLEDKAYVQSLFPKAACRSNWNGTEQTFIVELQPYLRSWGQASDEHTAWTFARDNLKIEGVLTAFPENGKSDES